LSLPKRTQNKILAGILIFLCSVFAVSLFKNIAYPLLWNDEAETAVFADRVLDYGYPRISDGKNILYLFEMPGKVAWEKKTGAYIGTGWGQYYYAVPGAMLARNVNEIYKKTAILRIPFAIIGFAGLALIVLSVIRIFKEDLRAKLSFLSLFALFEIISIPLVLHLREARYHSILVFLLACLLYLYINHKFFGTPGNFWYISLTAVSAFLLFNTFSPAYFIIIVTIILYECAYFFKERKAKSSAVNIMPFLLSLIFVAPLLIFFRTFQISGEYARFAAGYCAPYCTRVLEIAGFFLRYDFLWPAIMVKAILFCLWFRFRPGTNTKFYVSNLLSVFFIIYILVIAKMPLPVIFQRYYIAMQPILTLILLIDIFNVFDLISGIGIVDLKRRFKTIFVLSITAVLLLSGVSKIGAIEGHLYEITHRYRGPLDFVVPYIKANYSEPGRLVIATNYEEPAYMYYLGSKTTVGFVGNNIEADSKIQPDIIVLRKQRLSGQQQLFSNFLKSGSYKIVFFPVSDYPVNNIPELDHGRFSHLYETPMPGNDNERLDIFVKQ
jgi:hypothetical protein